MGYENVENVDGGEVVVVTGAASASGPEICRMFLGLGWNVVGVDDKPEDEEVRIFSEGTFTAGFYEHVAVDTRDLGLLQAGLDAVIGERGVRFVVAAQGMALPVESTLDEGRGLPHPDVFMESVHLNLVGHYNTIWVCLPFMRQVDGDKGIVLMSTINTLRSFGLPAYSAAKAGLAGFMTGAVVSLGGEGVRVNAVLAGTTPTKETLREWAHAPEHWDEMLDGVPLGKLGTPADVAAAVKALCFDLTHATGAQLVVDGGQQLNV